MYLVAAYENSHIVESSIRIIKNERLVLKHLRYLAKNQWPNMPMTLNSLISNGWFKVLKLETNKLSDNPRQISKGKIKQWIEDEKFEKVMIPTRRKVQPSNWNATVMSDNWTEERCTDIRFNNNYDTKSIVKKDYL